MAAIVCCGLVYDFHSISKGICVHTILTDTVKVVILLLKRLKVNTTF